MRTLTVHNEATSSTSQVKFTVEVGGEGGAFNVECPSTETACDLGPGEQRDVIVTFTPTAEGHSEAVLTLRATADNRDLVEFLAHGF